MTATPLAALALAALLAWLWLLFARHGFWRADQRLPEDAPRRAEWPGVVAVIPARDEADSIGDAVASLLAQDYPGRLDIVVSDDNSTDGTVRIAREAAARAGAADRLTVVADAPLPDGWTGKMWAVGQGVERAGQVAPEARYLLLTDADIAHDPLNLRRLVDRAEDRGLTLVSLMVLLRADRPVEKLLLPAFVFFFQKLYPFPAVNDAARPEAATASGCMLVRKTTLKEAGGIPAIRGELIDDCALARRLKPLGPVWLGLTETTRSLRSYGGLAGIWRMVARTAWHQLDYAPLRLAGTVAGMALLYLVPPLAAIAGWIDGDRPAMLAGLVGWLLMAQAFLPTLRLYGQPWTTALLLPLAGLLYTLMTLDSARRHRAGRGGAWKGRNWSASGDSPQPERSDSPQPERSDSPQSARDNRRES